MFALSFFSGLHLRRTSISIYKHCVVTYASARNAKGNDECHTSDRGDKGPPAITSVISQLKDWRGRTGPAVARQPRRSQPDAPAPTCSSKGTCSSDSSSSTGSRPAPRTRDAAAPGAGQNPRCKSDCLSRGNTEIRNLISTTTITMGQKYCLLPTLISSTCSGTRSPSCASRRAPRGRTSLGSKTELRYLPITIYTSTSGRSATTASSRRSRSTPRRRWTRACTSARPTTCTPSTGAPSRPTSPSPSTESSSWGTFTQLHAYKFSNNLKVYKWCIIYYLVLLFGLSIGLDLSIENRDEIHSLPCKSGDDDKAVHSYLIYYAV